MSSLFILSGLVQEQTRQMEEERASHNLSRHKAFCPEQCKYSHVHIVTVTINNNNIHLQETPLLYGSTNWATPSYNQTSTSTTTPVWNFKEQSSFKVEDSQKPLNSFPSLESANPESKSKPQDLMDPYSCPPLEYFTSNSYPVPPYPYNSNFNGAL